MLCDAWWTIYELNQTFLFFPIAQPEIVRGAESLPLPEEFRVYDLEDLEVENNLRSSRAATKSKIKQPKVRFFLFTHCM